MPNTRSAFYRIGVASVALLMLAACDDRSQHASADRVPDEWWSDNYLAMLQDAKDVRGGSMNAEEETPARIRLHTY